MRLPPQFLRLAIAASALSLLACRAEIAPSQASFDATDPSPTEEVSEFADANPSQTARAECQPETLPNAIATATDDYRLAQPADFVASIRHYEQDYSEEPFTCNLIKQDFNRDGLPDYALLLVHRKTGAGRFQLLLSQGNGQFSSAVSRDYSYVAHPEGGTVYVAMFFKAAGEQGPALRSYFPLEPETPERRAFIERPALELWKPIPGESENQPMDLEVDTLAYCSDVFYVLDRNLEKTTVCD